MIVAVSHQPSDFTSLAFVRGIASEMQCLRFKLFPMADS